MSKVRVRAALVTQFKAVHVDACLKYYEEASQKFIAQEWDSVALKVGKFLEAVTKALMVRGGKTVPAGKHFKAGNELRQCESNVNLSDPLRYAVPKACLFATEVVNNRLGRHDRTMNIDPHEMDAVAVMPVVSWVLAEFVRFCISGADADEAAALIQELTAKMVPFFEVIGGRTYVRNDHELKAEEVALLLLYCAYPERIARPALVQAVRRHGIAESSAYAGVSKLTRLVDDDDGAWALRAAGRQKAEALMTDLKS